MELSRSNSNKPINMESFVHIFLRPFVTHKSSDHNVSSEGSFCRENDNLFGNWSPSSSQTSSPAGMVLANERGSGLKMQEIRLQGYQLEGATLEHIVAARCVEGFHILSVSEDRGNRVQSK